jgi:hypothetical protein
MHPLLRRCLLFGSIAIVSLLALPAGAVYADQGDGHTVVVQPKQSIQAAIDNAPPGSTILVERGTYYENLSITKNHITLKTKREPGSVVLQWREGPSSNACGKPVSGICVTGQVNPVAGTRIDGLVVDGFPDSGVWLFNAVDSVVTNTKATNNKPTGSPASSSPGFVISTTSPTTTADPVYTSATRPTQMRTWSETGPLTTG